MAGSGEDEVDYHAVLNVKKEVKIGEREKGKEKYLINHVKCFLLHFRLTKMSLKMLTDACECCITLTNIKRSREKESKFKKALFVLQKKSVNREPSLVRTIFFTFQSFLNCHHAKFKDAVGEKIFLSGDKLHCSSTVSFTMLSTRSFNPNFKETRSRFLKTLLT